MKMRVIESGTAIQCYAEVISRMITRQEALDLFGSDDLITASTGHFDEADYQRQLTGT